MVWLVERWRGREALAGICLAADGNVEVFISDFKRERVGRRQEAEQWGGEWWILLNDKRLAWESITWRERQWVYLIAEGRLSDRRCVVAVERWLV